MSITGNPGYLTYLKNKGICTPNGGMPERLNGTVSKTVVGVTPPRVRIPVPPPVSSRDVR